MDPKYHKRGSSGTQSSKMSKGCNNLGPALHGYFMDQQNCSSMPEAAAFAFEFNSLIFFATGQVHFSLECDKCFS